MKIVIPYYVRLLVLLFFCYIHNSCTSAGRKERFEISPRVKKVENTYKIYGKASHYSDNSQNKKTASGERFNNRKFTAAHKTLPLGSQVEVCNIINQKRVKVTINDRGPFKADRIIDLSQAAFKELSDNESGLLDVEITVLP